MSAHRLVNPAELSRAVGYTHAVVATPGHSVHVAGQIGADREGVVVGDSFVEQFDQALSNTVLALVAAGAEPGEVVSLVMYTTVMGEYRSSLKELGASYRKHFGRHFPAMAVVGVTELVEPRAKLEIMATAVVTER